MEVLHRTALLGCAVFVSAETAYKFGRSDA
jgi:hypothetical protein